MTAVLPSTSSFYCDFRLLRFINTIQYTLQDNIILNVKPSTQSYTKECCCSDICLGIFSHVIIAILGRKHFLPGRMQSPTWFSQILDWTGYMHPPVYQQCSKGKAKVLTFVRGIITNHVRLQLNEMKWNSIPSLYGYTQQPAADGQPSRIGAEG